MKKRILSVLICLAMLLTAFPMAAFAAEAVTPVIATASPAVTVAAPADTIAANPLAAFADLEAGAWYESAVSYCVTEGYMDGVGGSEFAPMSSVTRAMAVTVLWRAEGSPVVNYIMPFDDVDEDAWYAEAVRWAASEKIVNGMSETEFAPDDDIIRQDLAKMVYAYEQYKGGGFTGSGVYNLPFEDKSDVAEYAYEGVSWLYVNKVVNGEDSTHFSPARTATRAELASILKKYILLEDKIQFVPMDYSKAENWMSNDYDDASKKDTKADVIFIYGTENSVPAQENGIAALTDEIKASAKAHGVGTSDVFDYDTRMYIPYYRQISLVTALEGIEEGHNYLPDKIKSTEAIADLSAALDYYFENYNEGRPFIIAGYSQGGACVQAVLEDYFGKEENKAYLNQLVAAYSIAYGVDKTWLDTLDYIDFAEGEFDTGVLLSWVTEGPGGTGSSMLVADDPANALVINPINWKRDDTYAKAEECLGTYVNGEVTENGLYNLQFNAERGCLICDNNTNYISAPGYDNLWGGTSLHVYEVMQAYGSIRQNMHDRINAFLAKKNGYATTSENYDVKPLAGTAVDYSQADNWLKFDENPDQQVDLFYIYPTVAMKSTDETGLAKIDDSLRASALSAYNGQGSAFSEYTNVYVPMYRQACIDKAMSFMGEGNGGASAFVDFLSDNLPRTDIYAALDYYFTYVNNGRPFILAGHSQGSSMSSIVLSEYFRVHPELLERMVACYAIGFPFSDEWLSNNPHLKFATGETDTGCIVSWNTEGPGATMANACIGSGKAYNINPLNWKTDDTYASADENLGSLINGELIVGFGDAQIDTERGAVICTTYDGYCPESMSAMMGDKSLHTVDYQLYYSNIKENGQKRIDAYLAK